MSELLKVLDPSIPIPPAIAEALAALRARLGSSQSSLLGTRELIRRHVSTDPDLDSKLAELAKQNLKLR